MNILRYFLNWFMYYYILIHELGHALCIDFICKKCIMDGRIKSSDYLKPVIVIGNIDDCIGKPPTDFKMGFNIFCYSNPIRHGITLSSYFHVFNIKEIRLCAIAGYAMQILCVSIIFGILRIVFHVNALFCFFMYIIRLLFMYFWEYKPSKDYTYFHHPEILPAHEIAEDARKFHLMV